MPEYEFRLRFNLANAYRINCDAEELELLALPTGERFRLGTAESGKPLCDNPRAVALGGPFISPDQARLAAEKVKLALLYWAVEQRVGIDFGDARARSIVTEEWLAILREKYGCPIRNDAYGIDIYEHIDGIKFVAVNIEDRVGKQPPNLIHTFEREFLNGRHITEKQTLACELYSGSFFDVSARSRFITLVMVIEALLDPARRPEPVKILIKKLETIARESTVDDSIKESIIGSLRMLNYESIGQAGRMLALRLLPDQLYDGQSSSTFFKQCYNLRSQILHSGAIKDEKLDILALANTLELFVSQLLLASLNEGLDLRV